MLTFARPELLETWSALGVGGGGRVGVGGGVRGGGSEVQRLGWLVGGLGARQPTKGGLRVVEFWVGGGVGGVVRGPGTGLAGRRPTSQATKTSVRRLVGGLGARQPKRAGPDTP